MGPQTHPIIVELEQVHRCITIEATSRLRDIRIKWLATVGQDERTVTNLFEITAADAKGVVSTLRSNPDVVEVSLVSMGGRSSQVLVRERKRAATAPYLAKAGVAWLHPTWSEDGVDRVTLLAPGFKNLKAFMDLVAGHGYDLRIKSRRSIEPRERVSLDMFRESGFSKLKCASELLTERQMEVFDLACRWGYYEEPKRITVAELAQKLDISESTCAELLRKAERKLMPILNDILRMMR